MLFCGSIKLWETGFVWLSSHGIKGVGLVIERMTNAISWGAKRVGI